MQNRCITQLTEKGLITKSKAKELMRTLKREIKHPEILEPIEMICNPEVVAIHHNGIDRYVQI